MERERERVADLAGDGVGETEARLYDENDDRNEWNAQHLRHLDALALLRDRVGVAQTGFDLDRAAAVRRVGLSCSGARRLLGRAADAVANDAVVAQWHHAAAALATHRPAPSSRRHHRSVLNILDSLLANQIPAKGVVVIVC